MRRSVAIALRLAEKASHKINMNSITAISETVDPIEEIIFHVV